KYADQFVRYELNYFYQVREMTKLIGEALVRNKQISEDDWDGVPQYIDYEYAKRRRDNGIAIKPQHDDAMSRIKPDRKNQADVYYFFNFNCEWCRKMTPDVERLYQAVKSDSRVRMVGLTIGPVPKAWMNEYRAYTGLTAPVLNGESLAKALGVR